MLKSHTQQQSRAYIAFIAIACVLFLCWSQQSNLVVANCPLQAQLQQVNDSDAVTAHIEADCDASGHLLQQAHANILDGGAAVSLFLALVLLGLGQQAPTPIALTPPFIRRYRPHLVFCVFNE